MKHKVIIDTDPGIDDAMAIHMAFADQRIEVIGLTSIFGNVTTQKATRNALRLAEMAHYQTVVASGEVVPLVRAPEPPADFVHGVEGFGTVHAATPTSVADSRSAAQFLCDSCAAAPGEITICAVGPLTNLAVALNLDTNIAQNVKSVVIMGGCYALHGNVTKCAEANIWNDPDAADKVFAADWDMTMIGLDVTERTQCTPDDFAFLAHRSPHIGGFLNEAADFYFDFHQSKTGIRSCFMHDPSAILAITDTHLFGFEEVPMAVVCKGKEIGRTTLHEEPDRRPIKVATSVDNVAAREKFMEILANSDNISEMRKGG